ncbi:MAG TPA: hypothetical protein VF266_22235 [Thermoanaerobaculia bacterium]
MTRFAHAVHEELWSHGRRVESRLSYGEAVHETDGSITATDTRDDALVARAEAQLERLRAAMPNDALVRLVAESTLEGDTATMTVREGALSIVTDPEHVQEDLHLMRTAGVPPAARAVCRRPLLWKNGTAAILLHEAHGHPLEHHHEPLPLPDWLHVEAPLIERRQTFRDVPLLRMQHVRVTQTNAPFDLPEEHIEVTMVDGGAYEPLTQTITIRVSASSIGAFTIVEPRANILFLGARGDAQRYPGVICSREGQELVVGSHAPALVTAFR